ncbi:hypothetical protein ACLOJK_037424 [Asimina triloba]
MAKSNGADPTIDHSSDDPDSFFRRHTSGCRNESSNTRVVDDHLLAICAVHHNGDDKPILKQARPHTTGTGDPPPLPPATHRLPISFASVDGSDAALLHNTLFPLHSSSMSI